MGLYEKILKNIPKTYAAAQLLYTNLLNKTVLHFR